MIPSSTSSRAAGEARRSRPSLGMLVAPGVRPRNATFVARVLLTLREAPSTVRRARSPIHHEPHPLRPGPTSGSRPAVMSEAPSFRSRYGLRVVAGAAVGLGAEYARQIAAHGLDSSCSTATGRARRTADEIRAAPRRPGRPARPRPRARRPRRGVRPRRRPRDRAARLQRRRHGRAVPRDRGGAHPRDVDVNCRAPLLLAHALVPAMVRRGRRHHPHVVAVGQRRLGAARGLRRDQGVRSGPGGRALGRAAGARGRRAGRAAGLDAHAGLARSQPADAERRCR